MAVAKEILKLDDNHRRMIEILQDKGPLNATQMSAHIGLNYQVTARKLRYMHRFKVLRKLPDRGNGQRYAYRGMPETDKPVQDLFTIDLSGSDLDDFLSRWSESRWNPKIFNTARNLPLGLARLYELAVEASYGSTVEPSDLDKVKVDLNAFKADLEQTLRIVNGVLNLRDLWSSTRMAPLLVDENDPEIIRGKAFKVREIN